MRVFLSECIQGNTLASPSQPHIVNLICECIFHSHDNDILLTQLMLSSGCYKGTVAQKRGDVKNYKEYSESLFNIFNVLIE